MKKVKQFLGVLVFLMAFGAAMASTMDVSIQGWRVVGGSCDPIDDCETSGPQFCKDGDNQLYELEGNNTCATDALRRPS